MSVNSQLTPLLPSTRYLLVYSLPLLLSSLLLTFSGTFLTLDRTRTFPRADTKDGSYASLTAPSGLALEKKKKKFAWNLEGGLGGTVGGFLFGIHLSTALCLMIPATTSASHLAPGSFLAIWIIICFVTTALAARYRYAALTFLGISGGTLFALALCIIAHPSLPSRITLTAIFLPLFAISILLVATLPITRLTNLLLHPFLRICTASTGAFGVIMSIALLMSHQQEGWANAWERLWTANSPVGPGNQVLWGSSQEQALSAGYSVFFFAGTLVDWALRRWIGECPDEKWDKYLANYTATLPNDSKRAGTFHPHKSFLQKLFPSDSPKSEKDILFPSETDMKTHINSPLPITMHNFSRADLTKGTDIASLPMGTDLLKKKRSKRVRRSNTAGMDRKGRKPVKFGDVTESSDDEDGPSSPSSGSGTTLSEQQPLKPKYKRGHTSSWSIPTLVEQSIGREREDKHREPSQEHDARRVKVNIDYEAEIAQLKEQLKRRASLVPPVAAARTATAIAGIEEIDRDDELGALGRVEYSDCEEEHHVALLRRPSTRDARAQSENGTRAGILARVGERHTEVPRGLPLPVQQPMPIAATPSLIHALNRLAAAHRDAYGLRAAPVSSPLRVQKVASPASVEEHRLPGHSKDVDGDDEHDDVEIGAERVGRSPHWEEFWREVQDKAHT